jgi:hypothetical protein
MKKPPLGVNSDGSLITHRKVSTSAIHDRLKVIRRVRRNS